MQEKPRESATTPEQMEEELEEKEEENTGESVAELETLDRRFESRRSDDLRTMSQRLLDEGFNKREMREQMVKELKRVRAVMTCGKRGRKKGQSSIDCESEEEEECVECKSAFLLGETGANCNKNNTFQDCG